LTARGREISRGRADHEETAVNDRGYRGAWNFGRFDNAVHIFRGPDRIFGFTAENNPGRLPQQYAPWTAFKSLDVVRETSQPGFDVNECLDDIEKYGFHLTDAHTRITERAVPPS
jgi:hypothetical protein